MNAFKEASKQKLRIQTQVGLLSVEQLWDLSVTDLDSIAVSLDEEYEKSGKKSYLKQRSVKDRKTKLTRDVVVEILQTKVEEMEAAQNKLEAKAHNDKINQLIAAKKDEDLASKSVEELEALLK